MAFPNVTDIVATTIESRSADIADNVSKSNALFARLNEKGKIKTYSGGPKILEPLAFAENANAAWYSGSDTLPVGAAEVISSPEYTPKQLAVAVSVTGYDEMTNDGEEAIIDLIAGRVEVAEMTMANLLSEGVWSDGTGYGGKQLVGLAAAVPTDPTTGTYGGINRANYTFWRSQLYDPAATPTAATIQGYMNTLWASCVRGADAPDLIAAGATIWATYLASLQALQRFTSTDSSLAKLGFQTVKYMNADVVLEGTDVTGATATDMVFLNTKYIKLRPHARRNMKPIGDKRFATNQDASVTLLGWMGNITCSNSKLQGRLKGD
jgi:hypothetical protein